MSVTCFEERRSRLAHRRSVDRGLHPQLHPEPAAHGGRDARQRRHHRRRVSRLRRHQRKVEAQQGGGRPEKSRPHPGAAARPVRGLHRVGQRVAAAEDASGSCSAFTTTSRCPSSCCRSRCRPTPTRRKPTARPTCSASSASCFDDGANVVFEHSSMGAKKAVNALATTATQALVAFGEVVHPVIELGSSSYENRRSDDLRPEVQRGRLRHRQAGTGGRCHLRRRHHHPADRIAGQAARETKEAPAL